MNKTITILKNYSQETLIIIAQKVIDVSEQKTRILNTCFEIPSLRNTGVNISASNGATA